VKKETLETWDLQVLVVSEDCKVLKARRKPALGLSTKSGSGRSYRKS
jgi:hypothetical protein